MSLHWVLSVQGVLRFTCHVCRLVKTNVTVLLVHPGIAATSLNLFMPGPINQMFAALSKGWTLTVPQVLLRAMAAVHGCVCLCARGVEEQPVQERAAQLLHSYCNALSCFPSPASDLQSMAAAASACRHLMCVSRFI